MRKLLWASLICCATIRAADVRTMKGVVYGRASGQDLTLDAYISQGVKPSPVVVYFHAGGWSSGDKKDVLRFIIQPMRDAGISIVTANYRLSGVAPYPACVDDCTRAVQFVRFKAGEWGLDSKRVAVMGASSGGHLALWVGLHPDRANPKSADPVERESTRVAAVVNYYGPADFHLAQKLEAKHTNSAYRTLFGHKANESLAVLTEAEMDAASPVSYISSDNPPVFSAYGSDDDRVPKEQAEGLEAKLKAAGVVEITYVLPGGRHGLNEALPGWPDFHQATVNFLKKYLLR